MLDQTAADYWSSNYFSQAFNRAEWQAHPFSLERLTRLCDGKAREQWFGDKYCAGGKVKRALGIGVGRAETEIALLQIGAVERYDLWDISPVGLDYAKQTATERGFGDRVTCHLGDFAALDIQPEQYDLVTFVASLHHFADLANVLVNVRRSLAPGGLMWAANEYVGPDRFDYLPEHKRIAELFHAQLPAHLRKHAAPSITFPTAAEVTAADPSESPVSSLIVSTVKAVFPRVEIVPLYGCLPFTLFWGLDHDALYDTPEGRELVRFTLAMDVALTEAGVLPSYFAHIVAHRA